MASQRQTYTSPFSKRNNAVTFPYFLNLITSSSIKTGTRRNCSMLCATFVHSKARTQPPLGLPEPLSAPNPHRLPSTVARDDEHLLPRELADWGPSPEQRFAQTEMHEILSEVIDKLEPDFRVVFVLRDVEELSTEETAKVLGISVPAVKSRLLRARLKLRDRLNRYFRQGGAN